MKLPKEFVVVGTVVVLLVGVAGFLGLQLYNQNKEQKLETQFETSNAPVFEYTQKFDKEKFTDREYVINTGSDLQDLVQIRGKVVGWNGNFVEIESAGEMITVSIPQKVEARCFPEYATDANGTKYKSTEIFMDFSQTQVKGSVHEVEKIKSEITIGEEILVQATLSNNEKLNAVFVVGYDCGI